MTTMQAGGQDDSLVRHARGRTRSLLAGLTAALGVALALLVSPAQAQTSPFAQGPRSNDESNALPSNEYHDESGTTETTDQAADDFTLSSPARVTALTWEGFYVGFTLPSKPYVNFHLRLYANLAGAPIYETDVEAAFEQVGTGTGGSVIYRFSGNLDGVPRIEVDAPHWMAIVETDRDTLVNFHWQQVADSSPDEYASRTSSFASWGIQSGRNFVFTLQGVVPGNAYRLRDLGTLGGASSYGTDLNESGQVSGSSQTAAGAEHAFLWDGTSLRDLGTLGGATSHATALNASGQVTGWSGTPDLAESSGPDRAFFWNGSDMVDLGALGGSESAGLAINESGWVAGSAAVAGNDFQHAFLWNGAAMQDVGHPSYVESDARAINASGWVTGQLGTGEFGTAAFLWNGTSTLRLTTSSYGEGRDINDSGWVTGCGWRGGDEVRRTFVWNGTSLQWPTDGCGHAINASGWVAGDNQQEEHAFVWTGGSATDLGTLGGQRSSAADINDLGHVTGDSTTASGSNHAFVWDGIALWDLNDLIVATDPLRPYVTLDNGVRVNNQGQILANGVDSRTGQRRAYLVTIDEGAPDGDADGVADDTDNCPAAANAAQSDIDLDGAGDLCDVCPADELDQCNAGGSGSAEVTPDDGGVVTTPDGQVNLDADPGDLPYDATISVTREEATNTTVDLSIGTNADVGQALATYDFEPDGLQFDSPVRVTIRADVTQLAPEQRTSVDLYRFEDTNGDEVPDAFVPLTATCTVIENPPGTFTAECAVEIDHFSTYAIVAPRDSDGDGVLDSYRGEVDACPAQDATGFDVDNDGCIDSISGLADLVNKLVAEGVIESQMATSLLAKVNNAAKSATIENICAAINQLEAFKNQVAAQTEKKISSAAATRVIRYANSVIAKQRTRLPAGASCG